MFRMVEAKIRSIGFILERQSALRLSRYVKRKIPVIDFPIFIICTYSARALARAGIM